MMMLMKRSLPQEAQSCLEETSEEGRRERQLQVKLWLLRGTQLLLQQSSQEK